LVAGPGVSICESCVGLAGDVLSSARPAKTAGSTLVAVSADNSRERCSFCGKRRHEVCGLASTGEVLICGNCLRLCEEILAEELHRARQGRSH